MMALSHSGYVIGRMPLIALNEKITLLSQSILNFPHNRLKHVQKLSFMYNLPPMLKTILEPSIFFNFFPCRT